MQNVSRNPGPGGIHDDGLPSATAMLTRSRTHGRRLAAAPGVLVCGYALTAVGWSHGLITRRPPGYTV